MSRYLAILVWLTTAVVAPAAETRPPNIFILIADDPYEKKNATESNAKKVAELRAILAEMRKNDREQ